MVVVVNVMPQLLYSWERNVVPIVQEALSLGQVWTGVENLASLTFET